MHYRIGYWIVGLTLLALGGRGYWQQRQEQQRVRAQLWLLDATLQVANERAHTDAESKWQDMQQAIRRNHQQPQDMLVLQQTNDLCQRADNAAKTIAALRDTLLRKKAAPTLVADANYRAELSVAAYKAYVRQFVAQETTPGYSPSLEQLMTPAEKKLASSLVTESTENDKASLPEALAMLSQRAATIRTYELLALSYQRQKIGCGLNIIFDEVGAFASAESNTVSPGDTYRAELFLTASTSRHSVQMTANGKPVITGPAGHGLVTFKVPPTASQGEHHWVGTIRTMIKGQDSIFKVMVPYTVRAN